MMSRPSRPVALLALLAACLAASSCLVGPNFQPPTAEVPGAWSSPAPKSGPAALARWWDRFNDRELTALVNEAMAGNLGVQQAAARVRQARASRAGAAAGLFPQVSASGSSQYTQRGEDDSNDESYQGGFDASWEIDLFGGTRRSVEAAKAGWVAAKRDEEAARLSLAAEVAATYAQLRAFQQQATIARRNLAAQETTTALIRRQAEAGFASRLDLANAETQVANTQARIPTLEASARRTIHALSLLVGKPPGTLVARLANDKPIPVMPPDIPAGLPSDLLRRRPDILSAEANAHAATARIGVAVAELFPKFSLGAALSQHAVTLDDWLTTNARTTSAGPAVSWSIFQGGRIRADIRTQQALRDESVLAYRQTVLTALQEVEDALIASAKEDERRRSLEAALESSRRAADLATRLYAQGQVDFLNVLEAQRSLLVAEEAVAQSTLNSTTERIALCKALGGGW